MTANPNPLDSHRLRRELLLEQAINRHLDELVRLATAAVLLLTNMRDQKLEESQLRNLAAVANSKPSVEVIANFIRYQIARAPKNWGAGPDEFGHTIIKHLYENIARLAAEIAEEVEAALGVRDLTIRSEAYIELARQYIGYLNRTFYYYNKSSDNPPPSDSSASGMKVPSSSPARPPSSQLLSRSFAVNQLKLVRDEKLKQVRDDK